jgi:hypothetical protein
MFHEHTHSARQVVVTRSFHAFGRGETMDFPDFVSPWERGIARSIDEMVRSFVALLSRWLAEKSTILDLTSGHPQSAVSQEGWKK